MAEDVNVEEEKGQGADAQQTFDDLTPLVDTITPFDAADVLRAGDGSLDWEEPLASQSLTTIHTGCRPTGIDLMAKLMPEGEDITGSEEITVAEQGLEAELADVEPSKIAIDPDDRAASEAEQGQGGGYELREHSGRQRECHDQLQRHPDKVGNIDRDRRHPELGLVLVEAL